MTAPISFSCDSEQLIKTLHCGCPCSSHGRRGTRHFQTPLRVHTWCCNTAFQPLPGNCTQGRHRLFLPQYYLLVFVSSLHSGVVGNTAKSRVRSRLKQSCLENSSSQLGR